MILCKYNGSVPFRQATKEQDEQCANVKQIKNKWLKKIMPCKESCTFTTGFLLHKYFKRGNLLLTADVFFSW